MRCQTPISVRNKADPKKIDVVPCGTCVFCLSNKKTQWSVRIMEELKASSSAFFITLTYSDECLVWSDVGPTLDKKDVQYFIRMLRRKNSKRLRYYLVGEYGSLTKRPHYHLLLFNIDVILKSEVAKMIHETWKKGQIQCGSVTGKSIMYTLKYMMKEYDNKMNYTGIQKPFALMSKGIGREYVHIFENGKIKKSRKDVPIITKTAKFHRSNLENNFYTLEDGIKTKLPRYYREKIYTKAQREIQNKGAQENDTLYSVEKIRNDARLKNQRIEAFKKLVENRKKGSL